MRRQKRHASDAPFVEYRLACWRRIGMCGYRSVPTDVLVLHTCFKYRFLLKFENVKSGIAGPISRGNRKYVTSRVRTPAYDEFSYSNCLVAWHICTILLAFNVIPARAVDGNLMRSGSSPYLRLAVSDRLPFYTITTSYSANNHGHELRLISDCPDLSSALTCKCPADAGEF